MFQFLEKRSLLFKSSQMEKLLRYLMLEVRQEHCISIQNADTEQQRQLATELQRSTEPLRGQPGVVLIPVTQPSAQQHTSYTYNTLEQRQKADCVYVRGPTCPTNRQVKEAMLSHCSGGKILRVFCPFYHLWRLFLLYDCHSLTPDLVNFHFI